MYYPYFRGKQFELLALREQASLLAESNIHPIIEPVKKNLKPLRRTIRELIKNVLEFTLIINPKYGDFKNDNSPLLDLISDGGLDEYPGLYLGFIIRPGANINELRRVLESYNNYNFSIIHYGFSDARSLLPIISEASNVKKHIFIENHSSQTYQRQLTGDDVARVLIRDGFKIMRNADYPEGEHFSDLHLTYPEYQMDGFGDFLIVGDHYTVTGGRPYAVTIHITYLDENNDMHIRHFISDRTETRADTSGKFGEAVAKLAAELRNRDTLIHHSDACDEYIELCDAGHFPQLGYMKKLSMQHHLELLADFLSEG